MSAQPSFAVSAQWLDRIRAGDEQAFEALFRAFAPGLCAFVAGYVNSREVAEELVQDLFLAMWRQRERLVIHSSVSTYLYSAARNRAIDVLKRERTARRFRQQAAVAFDESDPAAPAEQALIDMLELHEAIDRLPPRCRLVFTLSRQQGLSYQEIASTLGLSIKTVEVQIGRALKAIRAAQRGGDRGL